jgi:hypothetical protein
LFEDGHEVFRECKRVHIPSPALAAREVIEARARNMQALLG